MSEDNDFVRRVKKNQERIFQNSIIRKEATTEDIWKAADRAIIVAEINRRADCDAERCFAMELDNSMDGDICCGAPTIMGGLGYGN